MGVWCQEAWFGMALPSVLGSDFVLMNVSFLPFGSRELWGWGRALQVSYKPLGTKEPGKTLSVT